MKIYCTVFCWSFFFATYSLYAQTITAEKYIDMYQEVAVSEMKRSGIPASIKLAQGLLESGNGNSRLAKVGNNHFGIKCHGWEGQEIFHDDDKKGECFRHYKDAKESYLDHTDFLMSRSRYAFLFEYKSTDYKNWAKGLRKAGYATNPNYPQLLINLIERYDLHQYDTGVAVSKKATEKRNSTPAASTSSRPARKSTSASAVFSISLDKYQVRENNRTGYVVAKRGDTYLSISKDLEMMLWQLPKYNEVASSEPLKEGQIVYLQPKRRKAEIGKETHVVQEGETMYDVSQKYGVKLVRLYVLNRMEKGTEPKTGDQLNLRKKKKSGN